MRYVAFPPHNVLLHALGTLLNATETGIVTEGVAAFCGTTTPRDVAYDLRVDKASHPLGGCVHSGFWHRFHSIEDLLDPIPACNRPHIVCGFSMGAAMAVLYASELAMKRERVDHVLLFASPRIGDAAFASAYEELLGSKTIRFEHVRDPVVHLPPSALNYAHVGNRVSVQFDTRNVLHHDVEGYMRGLDSKQQYDILKLNLRSAKRSNLKSRSASVAIRNGRRR